MEKWELYTKDRQRTGKTISRGERVPDGYYRIAVHVCVFNGKGEMLIQHRQPFKSGWSDMWDLSAGGSVVCGEESWQGAQRELFEELGIIASFENERPRLTLSFEGGFNDFFVLERDGIDLKELKLQSEEVSEVRWASLDEVLEMIDGGSFIFYNKGLIELLFFLRNRLGAQERPDPTRKA